MYGSYNLYLCVKYIFDIGNGVKEVRTVSCNL